MAAMALRALQACALAALAPRASAQQSAGAPRHLRGRAANASAPGVSGRSLASCDTTDCPLCSGEPCPVCVQMKEVDCCLQDACSGCSGEQCDYCRDRARRGCCLGKWMAPYTGNCDGVDLPDYSSCPKCGDIPCPDCVQGLDVDACVQDECSGCSGEQCDYCRDEARQSCCLGKEMARQAGKCDGVGLPDYSSCPMCGDIPCPVCVQGLDVDACLQGACNGCSGEQCGYCFDEARRGCCLGKWMAQYTGKCDGVDLPDYSSCPKCGDIPCPDCVQGLDAADACLQEKCGGCSGEQCESCYEECKWGAVPKNDATCMSLSQTVPVPCPAVTGGSGAPINTELTCVYNPSCIGAAPPAGCFEATGCQYQGHS